MIKIVTIHIELYKTPYQFSNKTNKWEDKVNVEDTELKW